MIGVLGEGVIGEVNECECDGQRVAVKVGSKHYSSELDCEQHVENEISIYKILKDLQGSVIPRMFEGGLDPVHSASMVLITEKVGMEVGETDSEITVDGKPLDQENLILFKKKGLEGIRKCVLTVFSTAAKAQGTCVWKMRDEKGDRVCWLDFGQARVVDDEVRSGERAESEDSGEEIQAKSEVREDLEYAEEMTEVYGTECFEDFVDGFISFTDE